MTQTYGVDLTETRAASHYRELSNTGAVKKAPNTQILLLFSHPGWSSTYRRTHVTAAPLSHCVISTHIQPNYTDQFFRLT